MRDCISLIISAKIDKWRKEQGIFREIHFRARLYEENVLEKVQLDSATVMFY